MGLVIKQEMLSPAKLTCYRDMFLIDKLWFHRLLLTENLMESFYPEFFFRF